MKHPLTYFISATVTMILAVVFMSSLASVTNAQLQGDLPPTGSATQGSCIVLSGNIGWGTSSSDVTTLQNYLSSRGYFNAESTGYFGNVTMNAVKSYQTAHNLQGTGYVGPLTRAAIQTESCGSLGTTYVRPSQSSVTCPAGYTCYQNTPAAAVQCPLGYVCTPATTSGSSAATGSAGIAGGTRTSTYVPGSYYDNSGNKPSADSASTPTLTQEQLAAFIRSSISGANTSEIAPASTETVGTVEKSVVNDADIVVEPDTTTVAAPGTYLFTVNYGQSFDDMLATFAPSQVSDDVLLGMFPNTGSGQRNLIAKIFTVSELVPNASTTITSRCYTPAFGTGKKCYDITNYNISYDQIMSALKLKGYRPITFQELVALKTTNPQISGSAYGSVVKPYAPFINASKQVGSGQISSIRPVTLLNEPIIAVQDSTWTPVAYASLPSGILPTGFPDANNSSRYVVPSLKYNVSVTYGKYTDKGTNIFTTTGTKQQVMKLVTVRKGQKAFGPEDPTCTGLTSSECSMYGTRVVYGSMGGAMPAGYRHATMDELFAFESQYPAARGAKGVMALGSKTSSCNGYPWYPPNHQFPFGNEPDGRRYYNNTTAASGIRIDRGSFSEFPQGFNPTIKDMLFLIVKI